MLSHTFLVLEVI